MANKRKSKRTCMMNSAEIVVPKWDKPVDCFVVNVSYGGIGMYVPQQIPEGTDVAVRIIYNEGNGRRIIETLLGTSRWCRPMGSWFGLGIEFKYLNPKDHGRLLNFLAQHEEE